MTLPSYLRRLPPLAILCSTFALGVAACQSERDQAFSTFLQAGDVNRTITLEEAAWLFGETGDLTADPTLDFLLTNHGSQTVSMPDDFAARIFIYSTDGQSWSEIRNGTTYSPAGQPIILDPASKEPFNVEPVGVWPIGEGLDTASHLRVMVSGHMLVDDREFGNEVVAYVEIELLP